MANTFDITKFFLHIHNSLKQINFNSFKLSKSNPYATQQITQIWLPNHQPTNSEWFSIEI